MTTSWIWSNNREDRDIKNERTCIACKNKQDGALMVRIGLDKQGNVQVNTETKSQGRGAYICKSKKCCDKVIKSSALNRTFKKQIDKSAYDKLKLRGEEFE